MGTRERPRVVSREAYGSTFVLPGNPVHPPSASSALLGIIVVDQLGNVNLHNTQVMEFVDAMARLKRCVTDDEIATATGVSTNTIRRTRADPETRNFRPAPSGWEKALARLARERVKELTALAGELERE